MQRSAIPTASIKLGNGVKMIYDIDGNPISSVYDVSGNLLNSAYDVDGNKIYQREIKVMTYNVGGWYIGSGRNVPSAEKQEYYALQTGMITDNDPDVLVIQEYLANFSDDGTSALTMLQSLFPYVHTKTSGTYFGRAVCSKYPITNYTERQYTQESSRYFDSCTITIGGVPITFVDTHLGLTQANRDPEIVQLINFLNMQSRFVCCGDFNTDIGTASANTESTEYIDNVKPFIDEGFNSANFGDFGFKATYVDENDVPLYIDNIYTSSGIDITGVYVDTTKETDSIVEKIDHMPLVATLVIQ